MSTGEIINEAEDEADVLTDDHIREAIKFLRNVDMEISLQERFNQAIPVPNRQIITNFLTDGKK